MKGMTPQQLAEVTDFIQKHHRFGYVPESDALPNIPYGLCIKYIDACYDSRDATYWSVSFRGMGYKISFHTNNCYFKQYDSLYDLTMAYLNGALNESDVNTYAGKFCKQ